MTTVNSADQVQGLVLVRTAFVWTYMKGGLSIGLKFGEYYFKFHCKIVLISGRVLFFFGGKGSINGSLWVCNKTQL